MSSFKSRLILKCWSMYNTFKTHMNGESASRTVKIILTVLVAFVGIFLVFLGVVTQEEYDPVGFFIFMSFFSPACPAPFGYSLAEKATQGSRRDTGRVRGPVPCDRGWDCVGGYATESHRH